MALREKVGQLFIAGFDGHAPTDEIRALVSDDNLGAVIYFSRNADTPEQLQALSSELQTLATEAGVGEPLFVATDQEGGAVSRLDWDTTLPGQMLLGACGDPEQAWAAGHAVGWELRSVGVTMNLAPVLDVNNNPDNPVIGVRSFGEDPVLVGDLGTAMARGIQDAGVAAVGKHFPGHGDTTADSHESLPVVDHERDRLEAVEFAPFRAVIAGGIDAIMTTHVSFPTLTGDPDLPATIAPSVQRGVLRDEFGFDGLILTDCLEMSAIADGVGAAEGAVQAIEAGCDMMMVSHTPSRQRAAVDAVVDAVRSGRIPESRIDRSVDRIHAAKRRRLGWQRDETPDAESWASAAERSRTVGRDVAACGVTVARDTAERLPFDPSTPVHLLGFRGGRGSPAEDDRYHVGLVGDALVAAGAKVETYRDVSPDSIPQSVESAEQVVVACYDARSDPTQGAVVERLEARETPVAVLGVRSPYDLAVLEGAETFVATYDYTAAALEAGARILLGDIEARGSLPVTIPG